MTGYWVSVVTEDWMFRMVTPPKGKYLGVPLNAAGRRVADAWDPAKDEAAGEQCKSYGAAALMRVPGRLHITWDNDTTLKIETEAGTQTRLFHFGVRGTSRRRRPERVTGKDIRSPNGNKRQSGRGEPREWRFESGHHPPAARISAQERRALQRERDRDGMVRPPSTIQAARSGWWSAPR